VAVVVHHLLINLEEQQELQLQVAVLLHPLTQQLLQVTAQPISVVVAVVVVVRLASHILATLDQVVQV
jgi:hypothetical protein